MDKEYLITKIKKGSGMRYIRIPNDNTQLNVGDYVVIRKLQDDNL
jgi:hypothetical protein